MGPPQLRSLTNRLAALIFGITLVVIAGVYLGVTSGLDAGVREQQLDRLTRTARQYDGPIWDALNRALDHKVLDRRVRKAGDDSGTRVTLLEAAPLPLGDEVGRGRAASRAPKPRRQRKPTGWHSAARLPGTRGSSAGATQSRFRTPSSSTADADSTHPGAAPAPEVA